MSLHIRALPKHMRAKIASKGVTTGYSVARANKTQQLVNEALAPPKNKFNAKLTTVDGIKFGSKAEAERYQELKIRARAGEISNLQPHPRWRIEVNGEHICDYTADSCYTENLTFIVEDVKSVATKPKRDFTLVRKLMKAVHGIDIMVVLK